jgi:rod shape-determining protein MreC
VAVYRRARSSRLLVISLVMLSLFTITVDYRGGESGPLAAAGKGADSIIGPLQSAVSRVVRPIGNFLSGILHIGSLQSENEALRQEIRQLREEALTISSIQRELKELQQLFDLSERLEVRTTAATVIAESVGNLEWTVTIDRGSSDGLANDMAVVSPEGLVGRLIRVAPHFSTVQLIIDPRSAVAGRLVLSGETGLVLGQRDRDLKMDLIDTDAEVEANELVVTAGYQRGLYPANLPIGVVSHVFTAPGSLAKTVSVRPAVDFSALEFVLVVTGSTTSSDTDQGA